MTCIAVETIGRIFFKSTGDSKASQFIQALGTLDQRLGRQLTKTFRERLVELWPVQEEGQLKKTQDIKTRAELLYTFFRNSMVHGYRARAVYLSDQEGLDIEEGDGHLVLNPHWLWNRFKVAYEELLNEALDESRETSSRKHCLAYIRKILSEEGVPSE
ncbi:MAG: hypothetical protein IPP26_06355 [Flavobacteriales bacterium]|nr:hypothetical protein [Flavobacteriales bacterium]